jgi:hypothetical protein
MALVTLASHARSLANSSALVPVPSAAGIDFALLSWRASILLQRVCQPGRHGPGQFRQREELAARRPLACLPALAFVYESS